jgi:putative membrane-bound dehydrogenase-like protein
MRLLVLLCTLLTLAPEPAPRPLPPDKAAQAMIVPDGFHVTLFAAEPDIVQPIAFCLDDRGRLFVAEAFNYGTWQPTGKDRIVILEDTDGDGKADKRTVFYEGLNYITGIEVGFGGVWVMSPPCLYFIPDRDGDDRPDGPPQILFDGFGHKESRHNLANGFTWGPDGWLYAGHGRTSPSDVGRPGTPAAQRIHCDGGVYRIHPTRLVFENFADGTTNPWGVDFDDFGQCFVSNCVNPHLFHMTQGGHYEPWRNRPSSLYAYERLPTCADHLHFQGAWNMRGETSETLALGGGHAHCGTLIYLGDSFPAEYRNTAFMCNIHGRRINHDLLRRKGSGYTASHGKDFLLAGDPWFMGVTLRSGPDGSVFVSDWSDTGECHTYKPNRDTGRIYKISYGAPRQPRVDLAKLSDAELVKLQLHRNDWYVRHARRLLQERAAAPDWIGQAVHVSLWEMLHKQQDVPRRLRALWALYVTGGIEAPGLRALLDDEHEHLRAWAIQLLCQTQPPSSQTVQKFAALARNDPSAVVRLYLAAALQRLPLPQRWDIAVGLVSHARDADDANLPLMDWYGIEPLVAADPAQALRLARAAQIPLLRQFAARRLVEEVIATRQGNLDPLITALAEVSEPLAQDLLKGACEGVRGQKSMKLPAGWPTVYARLAKSDVLAIRAQARVLALLFGDARALAELRTTALSKSAPASERQDVLEILIEKRSADLTPLLHELVNDRAVRRSALRGLATSLHAETPKRILAHYREFSADEKQDAVATLASRKEYAFALLDAVEQKTVARTDLSAYVARQLHTLGDPRLRERLRQTWGEVRDTAPAKQQQLARYKAMLTPAFLKKADLANGRLLFGKSCQQCHTLFGEGGKIGPELTGSNRDNLDYLLSNLLDPSAEIGRDYRMSVVATKDGRVLTGMVVEKSASRLALQTATERLVLAPEDVESVTDSPVSMMPEGQLDQLTREQVRDLIGYLSAKSQVPLPANGSSK